MKPPAPLSTPTTRHTHGAAGRLAALALLLALGAAGGSVTVAEAEPVAAAASSTATKFLIPAYFYPNGSNWQALCTQAKNAGRAATLIMNPASGVGTRPVGTAVTNPYLKAIASCHAAGQHVIGYVSTDYAQRSVTEVRAEIASYYQWYGVDGIFLDEMSNSPATEDYYRNVFTYIHTFSTSSRHLVVGNPGAAASTSWQVDATPVADVIVDFEGTAASYENWRAPAWVDAVRSPSADRFAHLVYGAVPEPKVKPLQLGPVPPTLYALSAPGLCHISTTRKHGWIDVTYDVMPNPWDGQPATSSMVAYC